MPHTSLMSTRPDDTETVISIEREMARYVAMDVALGAPPTARMVCWACRRPRPLPGFRRYGQAEFCNACATTYEIARSHEPALSSEQFMRDQARRTAELAVP